MSSLNLTAEHNTTQKNVNLHQLCEAGSKSSSGICYRNTLLHELAMVVFGCLNNLIVK